MQKDIYFLSSGTNQNMWDANESPTDYAWRLTVWSQNTDIFKPLLFQFTLKCSAWIPEIFAFYVVYTF